MVNRWAIITGASSGIGQSTAEHFLNQGISVLNISRTPCSLAKVHNCLIDLSNLAQVSDCHAELQKILPPKAIITLVHNAAVFSPDTIQDVTIAGWQHTLAINLIAPSMLNQHFLPYMLPQSSIIYVGSTLSEKGAPGCVTYIASKHALVGLMRATMEDLAHTGIHTLAVCPGFTDTKMLRHRVDDSELMLKQFGQSNGIGRIASSEEMARIIVFCADNPALNGTVMHAHCGQLHH